MKSQIKAEDFSYSPLGIKSFFDVKGNLINDKYLGDDKIVILEQISEVVEDVIELNSDGSIKAGDEVLKKKVKYTPAHLRAQNKYREKNRQKYNEAQRLLYEKKIKEEEWKKHYLERSRSNNKKYRDKKKQEMIDSGEYVEKKRGRPRKVVEDYVIETKDIKDEHKCIFVDADKFFSENCVVITDEQRKIIDEKIKELQELTLKEKTIKE